MSNHGACVIYLCGSIDISFSINRDRLAQKKQKALTLQCFIRGAIARKQFHLLQLQHQKLMAIILFQSLIRAHGASHELGYYLFPLQISFF